MVEASLGWSPREDVGLVVFGVGAGLDCGAREGFLAHKLNSFPVHFPCAKNHAFRQHFEVDVLLRSKRIRCELLVEGFILNAFLNFLPVPSESRQSVEFSTEFPVG